MVGLTGGGRQDGYREEGSGLAGAMYPRRLRRFGRRAEKIMTTRDCEICGNEIPEDSAICKYCGSPQHTGCESAGPKAYVRGINIEAGQPTVAEAMARLESEILRAKQAGAKVVRLIHGWGSSGTGGKLRDACRGYLRRQIRSRQIKGFVTGDEYSAATVAGRGLMSRHPGLRKSERADSGNPGITLVEL